MGRLILILFLAAPLYASDPLTEQELREVILRLDELKLAKQQITLYERNLDLERMQVQREKEWQFRQDQLNQKEIDLLGRERDLWKAKAEEYQAAFKMTSKGRSKKCWAFKILTFGIARCQ